MKITRLLTRGLLPFMALLWLPAGIHAEGDVTFGKNFTIPVACGCDPQDEIDMKGRIQSINVMIAEYNALKPKYSASKEKLTPETRKAIQDSVNAKRLEARKNNPNARDYKAKTIDFGCFTIIDSEATECMREAVDDHESVHRKFCDDHPLGARFDQLAADYIQEEIESYQKELKRLNEELAKMPKFCALDRSTRWALRSVAADQRRQWEAGKRVERFAKTLR